MADNGDVKDVNEEEKVEVSSHTADIKQTHKEPVDTDSSHAEQSENNNIEMGSSLLASIEKLRGRENYSTWKFAIENYLAAEDMSACIEGTETDAKKIAKAKGAIILSIDKSNYVHVTSAKTAKEAWDSLKRTFEDTGTRRKVTLMRNIVNTKYKNCTSMEMYVNEIISTAQRLNEIGFTVDDEWLAIFLLAGLTDDYLPMIMTLESSGSKLSSDSVKTQLLQEPTTTESTADDVKALLAKGKAQFRKPKVIICYNCRGKGHKANRCPEKSSKIDEKHAKGSDKALVTFSAVFLTGKYGKCDWYVDSGATRHMTMHRNWMTGVKKIDMPHIRAANNDLMKVACTGEVKFGVQADGVHKDLQITGVLCVPEITANLISVSQITAGGNTVSFSKEKCEIRDAKGKLLVTASCVDGLYKLDGFRGGSNGIALAAVKGNDSMELWHRRLGHVNVKSLERMNKGAVNGMSFVGSGQRIDCVACCKGKQAREPFKHKGSRAKCLLERVHGDLAGKMECASFGGNRYALVLVDDFSRRTFTYLLRQKSETFGKFCAFKALVENETGLKIKTFRSDNGTEFCSNKFKLFFEQNGIEHQTSCVYTPQQNGLAERTIRTIVEKARCMLYDADLPKRFWGEALNTATYVKNHTVSAVLKYKSPIEVWTGTKPDISHFRVFGSRAMVHIPKETRLKFDAKSKEYIFVGYMETQKGYRLMDKETNRTIASRDVKIFENGNNFCNSNVDNEYFEHVADDSSESEASDCDVPVVVEPMIIDGVQHGPNNVAIGPTDNNNDRARSDAADQPSEADVAEQTLTNSIYDEDDDSVGPSHNSTALNESTVYDETIDSEDDYEPEVTVIPMSTPTRRSSRESRPVQRYEAAHFADTAINDEPLSVSEALSSCDKQHWQQAMTDEYQSLISNKTWDLVKLPNGCKAITNKWVFKRKTDSVGNVERYKARLVARGCSQRQGIDYVETFSPVVRYSSLRMLLALAVKMGLQIDQMDVVTAFLHGDIEETIYMHQPESFNDGTDRVCRLNKSIYGLKQASRMWNIKLNGVLVRAGFTRCKKDACIYVRREGKSIAIVAVYVDDLLIFYNNSEWRDQLKSTLKRSFSMKDLGSASTVLNIQIEYDRKNGILQLNQRKYTEQVLKRFNMFECDAVKLPSDPNQRLTMEMAPSTDEQREQMENVPYQEAVGSILYLAQCTRPDVSFSVTNVSQFNQNHGQAHWKAVKRILRYLKGTLNCKLTYSRDSKFEHLTGYSDADWGSSFCNFASCSGYVFLWHGGAISWASKKQPTVATSTAESEYLALTAASKEALWLVELKDEIINDGKPMIRIMCDNKGAIDLTKSGAFNARTKHISIRHYFIKELVERKEIQVKHESTDKMIADYLTKAVPIQKHQFCLREMGLKI